MSSVLSGAAPPRRTAQSTMAPTPGAPSPSAGAPPASARPPQNGTLTLVAGVGVLLLAMGVGVLIGRAGASTRAAPAQVISVASPASAASGGQAAPGQASFKGDWPAGTDGYTVQLQTLSQSGTSVSAVEAAKSAASAKGARAVGALSSEAFASLSAGSYVIYSGVFHRKAEAVKALSAIKRSFPAAKVIRVAATGSGSPSASPASSSRIPPSSESHPAPPSVLNSLKGTKGKTYEEKSKNLPNVVETG